MSCTPCALDRRYSPPTSASKRLPVGPRAESPDSRACSAEDVPPITLRAAASGVTSEATACVVIRPRVLFSDPFRRARRALARSDSAGSRTRPSDSLHALASTAGAARISWPCATQTCLTSSTAAGRWPSPSTPTIRTTARRARTWSPARIRAARGSPSARSRRSSTPSRSGPWAGPTAACPRRCRPPRKWAAHPACRTVGTSPRLTRASACTRASRSPSSVPPPSPASGASRCRLRRPISDCRTRATRMT